MTVKDKTMQCKLCGAIIGQDTFGSKSTCRECGRMHERTKATWYEGVSKNKWPKKLSTLYKRLDEVRWLKAHRYNKKRNTPYAMTYLDALEKILQEKIVLAEIEEQGAKQ